MYTEEWHAWAFVAVVALSLFAALAIRLRGRRVFTVLPAAHVAAAALIALFAWEALPNLPELVRIYSGLTAGLDDVPGTTARQAYLAASVAFVAGSALAAAGLLRRQPWAVGLGAGMSVARIGLVALVWANFIGTADLADLPDGVLVDFVVRSVVQAVPPIVALVLLAWPLIAGRPRLASTDPETAVAGPVAAEPVGD